MDNLVCSECGSEYQIWANGKLRGPGSLACEVCGEDMFLWTVPDSIDYDIKLIRRAPESPEDSN